MSSPPDWLGSLVASGPVRALTQAIQAAQASDRSFDPVVAQGSRGSSTSLLAGALALTLKRPVLLVVAHLDEADDVLDDLERFESLGLRSKRFGAMEVLPGETAVHLELLAERLALVRELEAEHCPDVLVAPVQALMQAVPTPKAAKELTLTLSVGDTMPPGRLLDWLDRAGFSRTEAIEQPGDVAVRGGIVDLFPAAGTALRPDGTDLPLTPVRLDFFGDELDAIHRLDDHLVGSAEALRQVSLIGASAQELQAASPEEQTGLLKLLPRDTLPVLHEALELAEQGRGYYERLTDPKGIIAPASIFKQLGQRPHVEVNQYSNRASTTRVELPLEPLPVFDRDVKKAIAELAELSTRSKVHLVCGQTAERDRFQELLLEHAPEAAERIHLHLGKVHRGFVWHRDDSDDPPITLVPHHELLHRFESRRRVRRVLTQSGADAFLDLEVGDVVVHVDHGIARFTGLKAMTRNGVREEYLTLEFAQKALLHVPASQIDLIQRYVGGFEGKPPLSALGGKRWKQQKQQVADAVRDLAKELLQVQAARTTQPGIRYPADTAWQRAFEAEFPYDETEDQLAAIDAIKRDMARDQPMDRLLCGDVGFGKTEVAIRAAFKAAEFGRQVAVLVPTTVLAEQHERTFKARFADYPFRVESVSRFKTLGEARHILQDTAQGQVDILIGTHRLLSKDVKFADLGMVIIDEEQRFGVEHKNRLLQFRLTADVLTMTATPIPRTLHMSMIGLRDISSLSTPPVDRRAVVTEVVPFDRKRIKQAIARELSRQGQVFFLHNRVHDIETFADDIQQLAPDARIIVGHGQMSPRELEKIMLRFVRHEADVLVCTTIIESGIDIASANTIIIDRADMFGLAELHQLRGRVGRSKHRAYCYLLMPEDRSINEVAAKRLKAIEGYSMLGAGFKIAMRDLELRGAGNILGAEQSGHIAAVGYEMYCLLLEQETKRLRREPVLEPTRTHLELGIAGYLPKRYVPSDKHRMEAYRRLGQAETPDAFASLVEDLTQAYGQPPDPAQRFFDLAELRVLATPVGIAKIKLEPPDLIFTIEPERVPADEVMKRFAQAPGRATVLDEKTVYWRPPSNYLDPPETLMAVLRKLLR